MPAGAAVPWLVATAVGTAGAGIYGAHKAAGAAKEAGRIQSDAANRAADLQFQSSQDALNFLRDEAAFNRQTQAPYRALGTGAVQTLANLTGVPMLAGPEPQAGPAPVSTPGGGGRMPTAPNTLGGMGTFVKPGGMGMDTFAKPGGMDAFATRGGTVLLVSPTGERKRVPASQAQHYIARGAQVVGGAA